MICTCSPASSITMSPEAAIRSAVPRSGCTTMSAVGMPIMVPMTRRSLKVGGSGPLVHVPGTHHRHRKLHDLRGLEAHEADVEPALRALADMARRGHHQEQQHADGIREWCEQAQVLRRRELGERQKCRHRNGDVGKMMLEHLEVLARCAVDDQHADADDEREHAGERPVEAERAQRPAAGGQGAAGARWGEFVEDHLDCSPANKVNGRAAGRAAPASSGQSSPPITGASQRL